MQHNMKFVNFTLVNMSFSLNQEFKDDTAAVLINPEITMGHEYREKDKQLIVILGLRQIKGNVPYHFEIKGAGLFQFDNTPEEKVLNQLSTINCPAILFPYVRETIADITRRAGFPPLHLAPINFIALANEREAEKKKAAVDAAK